VRTAVFAGGVQPSGPKLPVQTACSYVFSSVRSAAHWLLELLGPRASAAPLSLCTRHPTSVPEQHSFASLALNYSCLSAAESEQLTTIHQPLREKGRGPPSDSCARSPTTRQIPSDSYCRHDSQYGARRRPQEPLVSAACSSGGKRRPPLMPVSRRPPLSRIWAVFPSMVSEDVPFGSQEAGVVCWLSGVNVIGRVLDVGQSTPHLQRSSRSFWS
jgi:hypothetical protein